MRPGQSNKAYLPVHALTGVLRDNMSVGGDQNGHAAYVAMLRLRRQVFVASGQRRPSGGSKSSTPRIGGAQMGLTAYVVCPVLRLAKKLCVSQMNE